MQRKSGDKFRLGTFNLNKSMLRHKQRKFALSLGLKLSI